MCDAIRFNKNEFEEKTLVDAGLNVIGDEARVSFTLRNAVLPVHINGRNLLVEWGNKMFVGLPKTWGVKIESIKNGRWNWMNPKEITILCTCALVNGVWFQVKQGIKGVLVRDSCDKFHCYILTQPATHYFKIMTGASRMPALINQVL